MRSLGVVIFSTFKVYTNSYFFLNGDPQAVFYLFLCLIKSAAYFAGLDVIASASC